MSTQRLRIRRTPRLLRRESSPITRLLSAVLALSIALLVVLPFNVFADLSAFDENNTIYSIAAQNFRINSTDAFALSNKYGTGDYDRSFIARSGAQSSAWVDGRQQPGGTLRVVNDGGFHNARHFAEGDVFPVMFAVSENLNTTYTIAVTVTNGSAPALSVPDLRVVALNSSFGDREYVQNVTWYDNEDNASALVFSYDKTVDTSKTGIYAINYKVRDSDHNETTRVSFVLVNDGNWVVGRDYLLYAVSFTADYVDVSGGNREIIMRTKARAYFKRDMTEVQVAVVSDGNYRKYPGSYPNIVLAPEPEAMTTRTVSATINGGEWKVTFDPNGGALRGSSYLMVIGNNPRLDFLPQEPVRSGYYFDSWNTAANGSGTKFTTATRISSNMTVYAQWTTGPPPINIITPPGNTIINNPDTAPPNTITFGAQQPQTKAEDTETPTNPALNGVIWSLIDLLLAILAVFLLVLSAAKYLLEQHAKKQREATEAADAELREKTEGSQYWAQYAAHSGLSQVRQRAFYVNLLVLVIIFAAAVEALIILFVTQSFGGAMVWVDRNTIYLSLIDFIALLVPFVAAIRQNEKERQRIKQLRRAEQRAYLRQLAQQVKERAE